jgi:hypothetical protein
MGFVSSPPPKAHPVQFGGRTEQKCSRHHRINHLTSIHYIKINGRPRVYHPNFSTLQKMRTLFRGVFLSL